MSLVSCKLSVTLSKTLSACITDNRRYHSNKLNTPYSDLTIPPSFIAIFSVAPLAAGLAQYGLVAQLFFLLASPHLDPEERSSVLLTLGHCTVASGNTTLFSSLNLLYTAM